VKQQLFSGDFEIDLTLIDPGELISVMSGSYGDDTPLSILTTVTNNGGDQAWLAFEMVQNPNDPQTAMEKLERDLLAPGENRVFTHNIVLDEHIDLLLGNQYRGSDRSVSSILEPTVERLLTICLLEFGQDNCLERATNPELTVEADGENLSYS